MLVQKLQKTSFYWRLGLFLDGDEKNQDKCGLDAYLGAHFFFPLCPEYETQPTNVF